jgi:hypothetical protein
MKKLRGGKRRFRRLERLVQSVPPLNFKMLDDLSEYSVSAHSINPFADSPDRICSSDVQILLAEWLSETYQAWNIQLKKELKSEPYFLEVWLDAPTLANAKVICAKGAKIEVCKNRLSGPLDNQEFPYEDYVSNTLEALEWKQRQEPQVVMAKELEDVPHYYRMFEEMAYSKKKNEKGEEYLLLPGRTYWVGAKV